MINYYSSLEQIKDEFHILEDNPEAIRARLRVMQSSIHPDRAGGSFASKEDEELFHRIGSAIEFIDNKDNYGALVSISVVTDLTKAVTELIKAQISIPDNTLSEQIKDDIQSYRHRYLVPKITLSAITVALGAIWIFPNTVKDHAILSNWINPSNYFFSIIWFYALFFTVFFWLMVWRNEERQRAFQESLKTETVQNMIFRQFLHTLSERYFSIEDLVGYLINKEPRRYYSPFDVLLRNKRNISVPMANTIADIIIKRALSRQAIKKEGIGNISETYKIMAEDHIAE